MSSLIIFMLKSELCFKIYFSYHVVEIRSMRENLTTLSSWRVFSDINKEKKKQTWSLTGTLRLCVCTGSWTFTLTAGGVPSLGWDPCITLWWPLTSSSRFTKLLPVQPSAQEAVTFVSTSANFSALLSLFGAEGGLYTKLVLKYLFWADHEKKIFL